MSSILYSYLDDFNEEDIVSAVVEKLYILRVTDDSVSRAVNDLLLYADETVHDSEFYLDFFMSLKRKIVYVKSDRISDVELSEAVDRFAAKYSEILDYEYADNKSIVLDYKRRLIKHITVFHNKKGDNELEEDVLFAVPTSYNVNYNVFTNKEEHSIVWKSSMRPLPLVMEDISLKSMSEKLKNMNFVVSSKYFTTALACVQQIMYDNKLLDLTRDIRTAGFYIHPETEDFVSVDCDLADVDLSVALDRLEEVVNALNIDKEKAVTVLKWYLVAPFGFVKKQLGFGYYRWIYLWGSSKVGKTTLCRIFSRIWDKYDDNYDIAGAHANTQYRMGMQLSKCTYPLILNETRALFNSASMQDLIKSAVESTTSRSRELDGEFYTFPSFATCALTSNADLPFETGLRNRFVIIEFHKDEVLPPAERLKFDSYFKVKQSNSPLSDLQALGRFVLDYVRNNLSILNLDFNDAGDLLLDEMYKAASRECPAVFHEVYSVNSEKQMERNKVEAFRRFFIDKINRESRSFRSYLKNPNFQERLNLVLENEAVSYLYKNNKDEILISSGIMQELNKEEVIEPSLKSLALLLGIEYANPKSFNGMSKTCMFCSEKDLLSLLERNFDSDFDIDDLYIKRYDE